MVRLDRNSETAVLLATEGTISAVATHSMSTALFRACLRILRPLARILLRNGVTAHEFNKIAEVAFVAAAEDVLREQSRAPSFSRISSLTGIHRHAVSGVKTALESDELARLSDKDYQRNRLARVLSGWYEHPDFTGGDGRPRRLTLSGPEPSFAELARRFSGDIYPGIILDELQRVGAVRIGADGLVQPTTRRIMPSGAIGESMEYLGTMAFDILSTLEHNMLAPENERLFEDSAVSVNLPRASLPLLRRWVDRRAAPLLSDLEGWMAEHEPRGQGSPAATDKVRAGVAVVLFVDGNPDQPTGK